MKNKKTKKLQPKTPLAGTAETNKRAIDRCGTEAKSPFSGMNEAQLAKLSELLDELARTAAMNPKATRH